MAEINANRLGPNDLNRQALINDNGLAKKLDNQEPLRKANTGLWKFPKRKEYDKDGYWQNECEEAISKVGHTPYGVFKLRCQHCGDIFYTATYSRVKYCSYRCRNDAWIQRRKRYREIARIRTCQYCKKQFKARRKDAKFCCASHRVLAFNKKAEEAS